MRIKITADSTCDLPQAQIEKFDISLMPLTIIKDGVNYLDNVTITPADIFAHVAAGGALCSTAAGNIGDYQQLFQEYSAQYDGIIHISLGSGFSSSYQNACLAAEDFPNASPTPRHDPAGRKKQDPGFCPGADFLSAREVSNVRSPPPASLLGARLHIFRSGRGRARGLMKHIKGKWKTERALAWPRL